MNQSMSASDESISLPTKMPDSIPVLKKVKKAEDSRIVCTNGKALDEILAIVVSNITSFVQDAGLQDNKAFIDKFTETFTNIMHKNVSVNGLTWAVNKDLMTEVKKEEQKAENKDEMLHHLSSDLELIAEMRKNIPKNCRNIQKIIQQKENHNLRKMPVVYDGQMQSFRLVRSESDLSPTSTTRMSNFLSNLKKNINTPVAELQTLLQTVRYADRLRKKQQNAINDTGYDSE